MSGQSAERERRFDRAFAAMPIIAILRGLRPEEAVEVGEALVSSGITLLEVPLNSPDPLESIARLGRSLDGRAMVGAGTVLDVGKVDAVAACGGELIVSPNMDQGVIRRSREHGLMALPGCFTPTEAFAALAAGAHAIKLFPGELVTPAVAKALAAVLPATRLVVVGGVSAATLKDWRGSVVHGFGIGSALFKPGMTAAEVGARARGFVAAAQDFLAATGTGA
jgi:2-dehydro-3-deoxyphosphogalactonate aldolase